MFGLVSVSRYLKDWKSQRGINELQSECNGYHDRHLEALGQRIDLLFDKVERLEENG